MNKIIAVFLVAILSSSSNANEGIKKKVDGDNYLLASTKSITKRYGDLVSPIGDHTVAYKNMSGAEITIGYAIKLRVQGQVYNKTEWVKLKPYEQFKKSFQSGLPNLFFDRGTYEIVACTASDQLYEVCDHKKLVIN